MRRRTLKVSRTARYFEFGETESRPEHVWFVCHGYGHLAPIFLEQFQALDTSEHYVVAPEGLSRFYLKGATGRVGASWMTSEDRLAEISDYVSYLNDVYRDVFSRIARDHITFSLLGFSQGAATACRWLSQGSGHVDRLILWGGLMPPEHVAEGFDLTPYLRTEVLLVVGEQDAYISESKVRAQELFLRDSGISHRVMSFVGGHEIRSEVLLQLAAGTT